MFGHCDMHKQAHRIIHFVALLSIIGCSPEPVHTVSDGIYIFHLYLKGAKSNDRYRSGEEEYQLRFAKDGTIEFLDLQGRKRKMHGKLTVGEVELNYSFEGMRMKGTGAVTGDDRMEGVITAELLEVDSDSTRYRQVFEAEWSLIKKP